MPRSQRPRKPYRRPDYAAEAERLTSETDAIIRDGAFHSQHIDKPAPAPAQPHVAGPTHAARAPHGRGRYLVPVAASGAAVGGGAYLVHRSRRRKTVAKALIDPLTGGAVTVQKRYIDDDFPQARGVLVSKATGCFVPGGIITNVSTGRGHTWERPGTSHANKHTHVHTKVKARRDHKLFELHRKRRSVSGSSVGKAFSQSGASGRRLLSV